MKKVLLHIVFWLAYLSQGVMLVFLLDAPMLLSLSQKERIIIAIESCLVTLLPKLLFTYFMLYVILPRIAKHSSQTRRYIIYSIIALIASLFLYRGVTRYFTYPVIYHETNLPAYFDAIGFLVALMDVGFASCAAIVIKQVRLQLIAKEIERNLIREKLETELKYLRNQTNPHFLFNTLNNIYALTRKKSDDAPQAVMKLSKLLRFMLYESRKTLIRIGDEIKLLDDYIELEQIRYNGRLTINFFREIDDENEQISPLLLLPFIENAFKHGASESRFQSYIHIDMQLQKSILQFSVENTKESRENNSNESIGLGNVRRQLELMYKDYDMQVQNHDSVFKVCLKINLKSHAKI